jgi:hypothetical protein
VDSVLANEGVYNGTYSNVALGQPGPLPGSTATSGGFNGTSSYMQLPASSTAVGKCDPVVYEYPVHCVGDVGGQTEVSESPL